MTKYEYSQIITHEDELLKWDAARLMMKQVVSLWCLIFVQTLTPHVGGQNLIKLVWHLQITYVYMQLTLGGLKVSLHM